MEPAAPPPVKAWPLLGAEAGRRQSIDEQQHEEGDESRRRKRRKPQHRCSAGADALQDERGNSRRNSSRMGYIDAVNRGGSDEQRGRGHEGAADEDEQRRGLIFSWREGIGRESCITATAAERRTGVTTCCDKAWRSKAKASAHEDKPKASSSFGGGTQKQQQRLQQATGNARAAASNTPTSSSANSNGSGSSGGGRGPAPPPVHAYREGAGGKETFHGGLELEGLDGDFLRRASEYWRHCNPQRSEALDATMKRIAFWLIYQLFGLPPGGLLHKKQDAFDWLFRLGMKASCRDPSQPSGFVWARARGTRDAFAQALGGFTVTTLFQGDERWSLAALMGLICRMPDHFRPSSQKQKGIAAYLHMLDEPRAFPPQSLLTLAHTQHHSGAWYDVGKYPDTWTHVMPGMQVSITRTLDLHHLEQVFAQHLADTACRASTAVAGGAACSGGGALQRLCMTFRTSLPARLSHHTSTVESSSAALCEPSAPASSPPPAGPAGPQPQSAAKEPPPDAAMPPPDAAAGGSPRSFSSGQAAGNTREGLALRMCPASAPQPVWSGLSLFTVAPAHLAAAAVCRADSPPLFLPGGMPAPALQPGLLHSRSIAAAATAAVAASTCGESVGGCSPDVQRTLSGSQASLLPELTAAPSLVDADSLPQGGLMGTSMAAALGGAAPLLPPPALAHLPAAAAAPAAAPALMVTSAGAVAMPAQPAGGLRGPAPAGCEELSWAYGPVVPAAACLPPVPPLFQMMQKQKPVF